MLYTKVVKRVNPELSQEKKVFFSTSLTLYLYEKMMSTKLTVIIAS